MNARNTLSFRFVFVAMIVTILSPVVIAEVLYVDDKDGININTGTKDKPVKTIARAAAIVNNSKEPGPTVIKIQPGVYVEDKPVEGDHE